MLDKSHTTKKEYSIAYQPWEHSKKFLLYSIEQNIQSSVYSGMF